MLIDHIFSLNGINILYSFIEELDVGLVVKIDQPNAGANITALDTFQIINPETTQFLSVIDEEDISLVKVGQKVDLIIDSYPD